MRARDRAKHQDNDGKDGAGRERVAQQSQRDIAAGQALRHDSRADHGGEQEGRAEKFGHRPLRE